MDSILQEVNQRILSALEHLKKELALLRAGRANPSLIEEIPVLAYGSKMKLMEVGTITAPQPSLLTIGVWDPMIVDEVRRAISGANLGLNPSTDGNIIRLPIPPLTEERRLEFVKVAHQKGEACRVEIRQIRMDQREQWEAQKDSGEIGEDESRRRDKILQDLVDKSTIQVDEIVKSKERELIQV